MEPHIRWMNRQDMPEVLAIERESFELAWSEEDFIRCLRQRNCIGMVAEFDERVIGFMIYELHKTKLRLLNVAVGPQTQLCGIGAAMVKKLVNKLIAKRRTRIELEIRETNLGGQLFFAAMGFAAEAVLHDYYDDTDEDAYLMRYRIQSAQQPAPVNRITRYAGPSNT